MSRMRSCALVLLALAATAAVGAGRVQAAEPELGATIESHLYADEDRELTVTNRSSVPAIFTFSPSGGWTIDTAELTLAPAEQGAVTVTETGVDGATLDVRIGAIESPVPGAQRSEILLTALLYTQRPPDYALIIGAAVLAFLLVAAAAARRYLRRAG